AFVSPRLRRWKTTKPGKPRTPSWGLSRLPGRFTTSCPWSRFPTALAADEALGVLPPDLVPHVIGQVEAFKELDQLASVVVAPEQEPVGAADQHFAGDFRVGLQRPQRASGGKVRVEVGVFVEEAGQAAARDEG